jgi:hypothetical protein
MNNCPDCGARLECMSKLYFHSGKSWYGCKKCDKVFEHNYCSLTGHTTGFEVCYIPYKQYVKQTGNDK